MGSDLGEVVITGGTGYVGQALVRRLSERGAAVTVLSRGTKLPDSLASLNGVRAAQWDATAVGPWATVLEGAHAVVHLAGRQAVGVRFTQKVKADIRASRLRSTEVLVEAFAGLAQKPGVFVCASGVGYLGGHEGEHAPLDESAPPGEDFLAQLCVEWEARAQRAEALGIRVVSTRFAAILGKGGGGLATMALPFKLGVGGTLGSGRQIFAWVHLEDALAALELAITDPRLRGPVQLVAPNLLPNSEVTRELGRALHRPGIVPVPAFALRALFGEGAVPILTGQRAAPAKLTALGFKFRYPTLAEALAEAFA